MGSSTLEKIVFSALLGISLVGGFAYAHYTKLPKKDSVPQYVNVLMDKYDQDKDEKISYKELKELVRDYKIKEEDIE